MCVGSFVSLFSVWLGRFFFQLIVVRLWSLRFFSAFSLFLCVSCVVVSFDFVICCMKYSFSNFRVLLRDLASHFWVKCIIYVFAVRFFFFFFGANF